MEKILNYILPCLLSLASFTCFSQQNKIDSLLHLLKADKEDTNKVNHLNALGLENKYSNPDTSYKDASFVSMTNVNFQFP